MKDQPPTNYDTDDSGQHIDIIGLLWKTISLKKLLDSLFGVGFSVRYSTIRLEH